MKGKIKIPVVWDVTLCHWVTGSRQLEETGVFETSGKHSPDHTASYPSRLASLRHHFDKLKFSENITQPPSKSKVWLCDRLLSGITGFESRRDHGPLS